MDKKRTYNVLWTGGLDSTFRIAELSFLDCEIQPHYIVDGNRRSTKKEIEAMAEISHLLLSKSTTKANINAVKLIHKESISSNDVITRSYRNLSKKYKLGGQYDWFARYANENNIELEIGLESSHRGKANRVLESESSLMKNPKDETENVINPLKSSEDVKNIFAHFAFPISLSKLTKEMEVEWFKENNLFDVARMTWFCHDPVWGGYPCGHCNPCKDALNEGMEWRVPYVGRLLGFLRLYLIRYPKNLFNHIIR